MSLLHGEVVMVVVVWGVLKSVELGQHGGGQSVLGVVASGGSRLLRVLGERAGRD